MDATQPQPLRLTLIIPAYNEEAVIARTLESLPESGFSQVIVAVNGSSDRTADIARELGAEAIVISERGYGAACLAAMPHIRGEITGFLQADASEDAAELLAMAEAIARGEADLVIGSRTQGKAQPGALLPHQRLGNALATWLIHRFWRYLYTDLGPLRAIRTDALRALAMRDRNYGWTVEMQIRALQAGLRVREVPVSTRPRAAGTPKVAGNWRASLAAGWVILATVFRALRWPPPEPWRKAPGP